MAQKTVTEINCSDCGKTATVPFKPTPGKPVYCKECLPKHSASKRLGNNRKTVGKSNQKQAWSRRRETWK
jgi:CxxC-x17-CxxC domain-containing protein